MFQGWGFLPLPPAVGGCDLSRVGGSWLPRPPEAGCALPIPPGGVLKFFSRDPGDFIRFECGMVFSL